MEKQLIYNAFDIFTKNFGLEPMLLGGKTNNNMSSDGELILKSKNGQTYQFDIYQKKEVRQIQMMAILDLKIRNKDLLVIADEIFPHVKEEFRKNEINYIDGAGNAYIKNKNLYLFVDGKRKKGGSSTKNRLFSKAGLQVIYYILLNNDLINRSYRDIEEQASVALDTISKTINGLKEYGYIISINNNVQKLKKKNELLEKWVEHYNDRLKPKLFVDTFHFKNENDNYEWKNILLDNHRTCWGGEPGGSILTDYLKPEKFTLYSDESRGDLIKNYKLIPDNYGNVKVYHPFWQVENLATAPPLVVYSDLIGTGDPRNIETAKKILSTHLATLIQ